MGSFCHFQVNEIELGNHPKMEWIVPNGLLQCCFNLHKRASTYKAPNSLI